MPLRIEYRDTNPHAVDALRGLNACSDTCAIDPDLRRLVEVLVSKLNGCRYCVRVHTRQALELGMSQRHLDALDHWREAPFYTPAERALFAWVEHVTMVADGVPETAFADLKSHFTDVQMVDLTFIVSAMNAWNRMAIAFGRDK